VTVRDTDPDAHSQRHALADADAAPGHTDALPDAVHDGDSAARLDEHVHGDAREPDQLADEHAAPADAHPDEHEHSHEHADRHADEHPDQYPDHRHADADLHEHADADTSAEQPGTDSEYADPGPAVTLTRGARGIIQTPGA